MYSELKTKDILHSPLAAIPLPEGYKSVYKSGETFYFWPVVAATFQNFIEDNHKENHDYLKASGITNTISTLWEMSPDGLEPLTTISHDFIGIKFPYETLEQFLERVKG